MLKLGNHTLELTSAHRRGNYGVHRENCNHQFFSVFPVLTTAGLCVKLNQGKLGVNRQTTTT